MGAPRILRTTPFRLTLLFLASFAAAASAFLAYIYLATAGEVSRRADANISREMASLEAVYRRGGFGALNQTIIERSTINPALLYLLMDRTWRPSQRLDSEVANCPRPVRPRLGQLRPDRHRCGRRGDAAVGARPRGTALRRGASLRRSGHK